MTKTYKIKSPAKINIGLRVLSKRKDGYHNIETIFYPVKLNDEITVKIEKINSTGNKISVKCSPALNIREKDNICYKAAGIFLSAFNIKDTYKVDIKINKHIPTGAGLGGGSSNAANILKVMAKHFRIALSSNKILRLAKSLGSDVPFFLTDKPAYGTGRGEKLTPLPAFKVKGKILIINPGIHIQTPWAYKELKIKNYKLKILNKISIYNSDDERLMINDFERVVFKKYPAVEKIKYNLFACGAEFALMSGSGSTVYGIFPQGKIKKAEKYFKDLGYRVFAG